MYSRLLGSGRTHQVANPGAVHVGRRHLSSKGADRGVQPLAGSTRPAPQNKTAELDYSSQVTARLPVHGLPLVCELCMVGAMLSARREPVDAAAPGPDITSRGQRSFSHHPAAAASSHSISKSCPHQAGCSLWPPPPACPAPPPVRPGPVSLPLLHLAALWHRATAAPGTLPPPHGSPCHRGRRPPPTPGCCRGPGSSGVGGWATGGKRCGRGLPLRELRRGVSSMIPCSVSCLLQPAPRWHGEASPTHRPAPCRAGVRLGCGACLSCRRALGGL